jgi:hypothetical protein
MEKLLSGIRVTRRKALREETYEAIKKAILRGTVKPGQRLKEEQLASEPAEPRLGRLSTNWSRRNWLLAFLGGGSS